MSIALRLANGGADIAFVDINEAKKMKAVAGEVSAIGRKATTFKTDATNRDDVSAAIDHGFAGDVPLLRWSGEKIKRDVIQRGTSIARAAWEKTR